MLTVKSETELESIGLINGLDREYRDLYTVIIRASRLSEDTFTSVSIKHYLASDIDSKSVAIGHCASA